MGTISSELPPRDLRRQLASTPSRPRHADVVLLDRTPRNALCRRFPVWPGTLVLMVLFSRFAHRSIRRPRGEYEASPRAACRRARRSAVRREAFTSCRDVTAARADRDLAAMFRRRAFCVSPPEHSSIPAASTFRALEGACPRAAHRGAVRHVERPRQLWPRRPAVETINGISLNSSFVASSRERRRLPQGRGRA